MSSTKRGSQRSPADQYPTGAWCIHRFLEGWEPSGGIPGGRWLEPGAGEGNIIHAAKEWVTDNQADSAYSLTATRLRYLIWDAVELREECEPFLRPLAEEVRIGDYFELGPPTPHSYQVVITNPPFRLAQEFILRSLDANCRFVIMLLRVNYVGSERRHAFMQRHAPDIYVLPNRPSFKLTGETDSIEYGWFVWDKENLNRSYGSMKVLGLTPVGVRKKEHARLQGLGLFFDDGAEKRVIKKKSSEPLPEPIVTTGTDSEGPYCTAHGPSFIEDGRCLRCV